LYSRFSREELGGMFLGLMAYLDPKGEGDNSMPVNQQPGPVPGTACWEDPRDMVKARLPEPQSPADVMHPSAGKALKPAPVLRGR
jgi:hypothetical protein